MRIIANFMNRNFNFRVLVILAISFLILPVFCFAQNQPPTAPEIPEEMKSFWKKTLEAFRVFPQVLKEAWQEALKFWQKMLGWAKNLWDSYILPWLKNVWQKFLGIFGQEIEKRKPIIKEEFEKEKEEMKEEIKTEVPKTGKNLWGRFKELIK